MNYGQIKSLTDLGYTVEEIDRNNHRITSKTVNLVVTYLDTNTMLIRVANEVGRKFFYDSYDEFLWMFFHIERPIYLTPILEEIYYNPASLAAGQIVSHEPVVRDDY